MYVSTWVKVCNCSIFNLSMCYYYYRLGPRGTALCAYRADNSGDSNRGIFEVFRDDLFRFNNDGTTVEVQNRNFMVGF